MDQKATVRELCESITKEMTSHGYALRTIRQFQYNCNRFMKYLLTNDLPPEFTETVGAAYLKDTFGFDERTEPGQLSPYAIGNVNAISKLGEYRLHGTFHSELKPWTTSCNWAAGDKAYVEMFISHELESGKSKNTISTRRHALRYFYEFLGTRGIAGVDGVNGQILSDYVRSRERNSHNYLCCLLSGLKLYFRFLHHQGICAENLELAVPVMHMRQNVNVPALWSEEELRQLLTSIDRSNPSGKRDYAILLLAAQLGIRTSDIAGLKLSNLNFDRKTIEFTQHKTGKAVAYPMLDDIGWALIDWLRYGRANVQNPHVFLTCHKMPTEFADGNAVGSILKRRMKLCGIRKEAKNTTSGMHSLRHAMARRLVENDTGLHGVVSIMGHRNTDATSKYVRTDIEGLRECALSIGGAANAGI